MPGSPVKRARRSAAATGGDIVAAGEEAKRRQALSTGSLRTTPSGRKVAELAEQLVDPAQLAPAPYNPAKGLTEKQSKFVQFKAAGMSDTMAARHAGYPHARVAAKEVAGSETVRAALAAERTQYEEQGAMTKKRVLDGFLEAIQQGKMLTDPIAQIAGWREIAKLCGYYEPQRHEIAVSVQGNLIVQKIQSLSDDELLKLAEGDVIEGEILDSTSAGPARATPEGDALSPTRLLSYPTRATRGRAG